MWSIPLISASLCLLNICFFPQVFPQTKLTTLFLSFLTLNTFIWAIYKVFIYPFWFSPLRHLPRPKSSGTPILGHGSVLFKRPAGNAFLKFMTEVPNDGIICFPGIFNFDWLILTDPKALAEVLVHRSYEFEKPGKIRMFLRIILGDGLIVVEGDEHKFQRKHLTPAFSFRHVKELCPLFWAKASELTRCVAAEVRDNQELSQDGKFTSHVEINHWANKVTMDIIGVAGLGRDLNSLNRSDDELINNYEEILEPSNEKSLFFAANLLLSRPVVSMLPWGLNKRLVATTSALRNVCYELVRDKKQSIKMQKEDNIDILSLLIKSNNFSDDSLVDQLLTFLAAGHETTSSAFTWATYFLAKNPEVQSRLREEIRTNLPSPSTKPDSNVDLASLVESLPYLNAICNETLRLYPPIPVTTRITPRDTTILDTHVPKGTRIFISPYAINRAPQFWGENAGEFYPERWIDAETGRANNTGGVTSNYSLLTFLHGPRSCIGERFAKLELKVLVAVFCGMFQMEMSDPNEVPIPAGAITSKPMNGLKVKLQTLDGW